MRVISVRLLLAQKVPEKRLLLLASEASSESPGFLAANELQGRIYTWGCCKGPLNSNFTNNNLALLGSVQEPISAEEGVAPVPHLPPLTSESFACFDLLRGAWDARDPATVQEVHARQAP